MSSPNLRNLVDPQTKVITSSSTPSASRKALISPNSSESEPVTLTVPATLHLVFPTPVKGATHLALTFQGGFVASQSMVYCATRRQENESEVRLGLIMGGRIYPEDKNKRQVFEIPYPPTAHQPSKLQSQIKESLPQAMTSQGDLGPTIVTERPANPAGGGQPAGHYLNGERQGTLGEMWTPPDLEELKLEFEQSSDQYGRVTLYSIEVLG